MYVVFVSVLPTLADRSGDTERGEKAKGGVWNIVVFVLLSAVAPCFLCILSFEKLSELPKTIGLMQNANMCLSVKCQN